jgi:tetratricopeptide (TPR) repeat protein
MNRVFALILALLVLGAMAGCGPATLVVPPETEVTPAEPPHSETSDQTKLKDGLTGREMSAGEVADLSDRLLADGNNTYKDQETMARLELLILKTMKGPDKNHRPTLWRNLGIIHYHQQKYKQARQELQASNELNPKSARTHFYLACLFVHQGQIYEKTGKKRISRQQFKRAAIEMEQARKLDPHNSLYSKDPKQIIQQENDK